MKPRILLVDDDTIFRTEYVEFLRADGFDAEGVGSPTEALEAVRTGDWDILISDERFHGGEPAAAGLLRDVADIAPEVRTLVVTAYPTESSVQEGFEAGAYDYLVKNDVFEVMLRVKVRNALEAQRRSRLATMPSAALEREIRELWRSVQAERDANRRGRVLEELVLRLLHSVRGWSNCRSNATNRLEEIDLVVRNESPDPYWRSFGPYFCVECKNWRKPVGRPEVDLFAKKLSRRSSVVRLGFLVSVAGFAATAREALRHEGAAALIVPIDGVALARLVESTARDAVLREYLDNAVIGPG